jgi:hypothetical protein
VTDHKPVPAGWRRPMHPTENFSVGSANADGNSFDEERTLGWRRFVNLLKCAGPGTPRLNGDRLHQPLA